MKNLIDIYSSIKSKFYKNTGLDIAEGSVLDSFFLASSSGLEEAYREIENAKNPHIYTNLKERDIDKLGMLVGISRQADESDQSYLTRVLNWNVSNKASNLIAIEDSLQNLEYSNNVTYIPLTHGVGTATAYVIPKDLSEQTVQLAKKEVEEVLSKVSSPSSYTQIIVPKISSVDIICFISIDKDANNVKANIESKIKDYINNIAPGESIEVGKINKIGINENNVSYFSVSNLFIDDEQLLDLSKVQMLEEKMVFRSINWQLGGIV